MESTVSIIAAIGKNRELGAKNKLLWHIPGELPRFKRITMGHPIIMGRKTYESIGRPLPGRTNIVITRDSSFVREGVVVCNSIEEALELGKKIELENYSSNEVRSSHDVRTIIPEVFIIGGGQIYEQALQFTDRIYLTLVDREFPEADAFFPEYSEFNKIIEEEEGESEEFRYKFVTLEKSS